MTTFDLRQHIRTVIADTDEENLDALAKLVYDRTPRNMMREAYRQALTEAVRSELPRATRPAQSQFQDQRGDSEAGSTSTTGEDQAVADTQTQRIFPGGGNVRRSRAAMFRRARFRLNVHVGSRTFRNILDCTADDLMFAASECEQMADANARAAARYRRLVKVMNERQVEQVSELTDDEIAEVIGSE